jgi:small-conductance mechanosensitive channel
MILARVLRYVLGKYFDRVSGQIHVDKTRFVFFTKFTTFIIYVIGMMFIIYSIPEFRTIGTTLLASAGIMAVIVGFATQQMFSNIVAGVFISIFQPIRVGDRIKVSSYEGYVEDINLRHTVIRALDHNRIIIPNSKLSEEYLLNYDIEHSQMSRWFEVTISYKADIDKTRAIMLEETKKNPNNIIFVDSNNIKHGPTVQVTKLTELGVVLRLEFWSDSASKSWDMMCDLQESIKKRFDKAKIEFAYPRVNIKN